MSGECDKCGEHCLECNCMKSSNGWISVKDKLPDEGVQVLTINNPTQQHPEYKLDYIVKFYKAYPELYIWARRLCNEYEEVTHWMPLPEPPKD